MFCKNALTLLVLLMLIQLTLLAASSPGSSTIQQLNQTPLTFTKNMGQWDSRVLFRANAGGATMWFTKDGVTYQFTRSNDRNGKDPVAGLDSRLRGNDMGRGNEMEPDSIEQLVLIARFNGANPNPEVVAEGELEYKCNYFIGNDPAKWHTDVPNYESITLKDIYPGIDLKYSGDGNGQAAYEFVANPGADMALVKVEYEGAEQNLIDADGRMILRTKWGDMVAAVKAPADGDLSGTATLSLAEEKTIGFRSQASSRQALGTQSVVLSYSTYLGGSGFDASSAVAVDSINQVYLTGYTTSTNYPGQYPYQTDQGGPDAFVTKLSSSNDGLIYSTYIGGSGSDGGRGIAVDRLGCVYIASGTNSTDFPIQDPYQTFQGIYDVAVTKLNSAGNAMLYSTYVGGTDDDSPSSIAIDESGSAYVTGLTFSADLPTENPYQTYGGNGDAYVIKMSPSGSALNYCTYLGGSSYDWGTSVAVQGGSAFVTGHTGSVDFPTENPLQSDQGATDVFVTKMSVTGNALVYSTYLGGDSADAGHDIEVDGSGNAYVTGYTRSTNFPTQNPYQTFQGCADVFVAQLNSTGTTLNYCTYLGGNGDDAAYGVALDSSGNVLLGGVTWSTDFPTLNSYQTDRDTADVFATKLSASGSSLIYSTYLGGESHDEATAIAVDGGGNAYVTGYTTSAHFPTTQGAYDGSYNGGFDAFVSRLSFYPPGQNYFSNESYDLNDNQVPAGWQLVQHNGSGGLQNGQLNAYHTDAYWELVRTGTVPPPPSGSAIGFKLQWDGNVAYSNPGMSTSIHLLMGTCHVTVGVGIGIWRPGQPDVRIFDDCGHPPDNPLYTQAYPVDYTAYRNTVTIWDGQLQFKSVKIADGSVVCDAVVSDASIVPNQLQELGFAAYTTVTADAWLDNISVEVLSQEYLITPTPDTADVFYVRQADIDGDNYADVVYTGNTSDSLYIAYGKADGTLETPRNYLKVTKAALAVDFVDGDSLLDIVAHTPGKVYLLLNNGNRTFSIDSQTVSLSSSWGSNTERSGVFPSIATGYFNGDAYLDAVVSENKILFGDGSGSFPTSMTLPFSFDAVEVGDFDRNGTDDIVVTSGDSAVVYVNNGSGNMTRSAALRIGYLAHDFSSIVAGMDLNHDGNSDFVTVTGNTVGTNDTSVVTIALGNGSGGVGSSDTLRIVGTALNLALADVDKDGDLDISLVNATTRSLLVSVNIGAGSFAAPVSIALGSGTSPLYALISADVDRNGAPDFVIGGQEGNPILLAVSEIPEDPILPDEMVTTGYNNVTLRVENPLGLVISRLLRTVAGSAYWRSDADDNGVLDESAYDYNLQYGEYQVVITSRANIPGDARFSAGIRIDGTAANCAFRNYPTPAPGDSLVFYYQVQPVSSIYPANGHPTANPQPTFNWSGLASKGLTADSYEFQLDRYYDFRSPIFSVTGLTSPLYQIPQPLGPDSVYYWRIRPVTSGTPGIYSRTFAAYLLNYLCGNANADAAVDISDAVYLIQYIFSGGPAPSPVASGDANCDQSVDISDVVYLIQYIFSSGPQPCEGCK